MLELRDRLFIAVTADGTGVDRLAGCRAACRSRFFVECMSFCLGLAADRAGADVVILVCRGPRAPVMLELRDRLVIAVTADGTGVECRAGLGTGRRRRLFFKRVGFRLGLAAARTGADMLVLLVRGIGFPIAEIMRDRIAFFHVAVHGVCLHKAVVQELGGREVPVMVVVDRDELVDIGLQLALMAVRLGQNVLDGAAGHKLIQRSFAVAQDILDFVQHGALAFELRQPDHLALQFAVQDGLQRRDALLRLVDDVDDLGIILIGPVAQIRPLALIAEGQEGFQLVLELGHAVVGADDAVCRHLGVGAVIIMHLVLAEREFMAHVVNGRAAQIEDRTAKALVLVDLVHIAAADLLVADAVDLFQDVGGHVHITRVLFQRVFVGRFDHTEGSVVELLDEFVKVFGILFHVGQHLEVQAVLDLDAVNLRGIDLRRVAVGSLGHLDQRAVGKHDVFGNVLVGAVGAGVVLPKVCVVLMRRHGHKIGAFGGGERRVVLHGLGVDHHALREHALKQILFAGLELDAVVEVSLDTIRRVDLFGVVRNDLLRGILHAAHEAHQDRVFDRDVAAGRIRVDLVVDAVAADKSRLLDDGGRAAHQFNGAAGGAAVVLRRGDACAAADCADALHRNAAAVDMDRGGAVVHNSFHHGQTLDLRKAGVDLTVRHRDVCVFDHDGGRTGNAGQRIPAQIECQILADHDGFCRVRRHDDDVARGRVIDRGLQAACRRGRDGATARKHQHRHHEREDSIRDFHVVDLLTEFELFR